MKPKNIAPLIVLSYRAPAARRIPAARTILYHAKDIVNIRAKVKYTTLIQLPATEKIIEAATGDKEFWIIDVVGNFCFVHPAKKDIQLESESHYRQGQHLFLHAGRCFRSKRRPRSQSDR